MRPKSNLMESNSIDDQPTLDDESRRRPLRWFRHSIVFLFLGTTRNEMVFIFVEKWGEKMRVVRGTRSGPSVKVVGTKNEEKKMKGNDTARKKSQIIFSEKANLFLLFHRYRMKSTQTECYLLIYSEKKCTDFL